jgi:hypothetical protein
VVKTIQTYQESIIWSVALLLLFFMDANASAVSFCIPSMLGFQYCPGCGIGHAIHHALHLKFAQSFQEHWLGLPATIGILYLIIKPFISPNKHHAHDEPPTIIDVHA